MDKSEEIKTAIAELHREIDRTITGHSGGSLCVPLVLKSHAKMLDLTAQLADISSQRLERHTQKLVGLTWALVWLTVGLIVVTLGFEILK